MYQVRNLDNQTPHNELSRDGYREDGGCGPVYAELERAKWRADAEFNAALNRSGRVHHVVIENENGEVVYERTS